MDLENVAESQFKDFNEIHGAIGPNSVKILSDVFLYKQLFFSSLTTTEGKNVWSYQKADEN